MIRESVLKLSAHEYYVLYIILKTNCFEDLCSTKKLCI